MYYGNGKIITLLQKEENDPRIRGESLLFFKYKEDENIFGLSVGLYLYLPQGKKLEDGLEVIR